MGFIFESEIESIINSVRAHTIGEDESITLRRVLTAHIHPAIKAYFRAEVERLLKQERELELRSKKFPYTHPEIMSLQLQMDRLLMQHYQFVAHDFESLLDESVHFQFNYLCRPQWTLLNFVFGGQRKVSTSVVERKLAYCVDYLYFGDLVRRYVIDKGLAEISYEEFRRILKAIDDEVVSQHSSQELARLMRAMTTFVDAGVHPAQNGSLPSLPVNAAIVFFEDKGIETLRNRLEVMRDTEQVATVTLTELANVIERVRSGDPNAVAPEDETPDRQPGAIEQSGVLDADESRSASAAIRMEEAEVLPDTEVAGSNGGADSAERTPVFRPLEEFISQNDRKLFIRRIFGKSEKLYAESVARIEGMPSWEEASHLLDSMYVGQKVDPFSPEAIQFTDRVYARFHS